MDLTRKRVLVVDDHPGMLSSLRHALAACGISTAHAVRNAQEAIERLRNMRYDLVLADYDLGAGPDGQQLLEHCRSKRLLAPTAAFVLVTAERGYDRVMSAAEFTPDDYLVKPFTEDTLKLRLERVLAKKESLATVHTLAGQGRHEELLEACDRVAAAEPRHAIELARVKGEALLALGRYPAARAHYESMLALRPLPWARLGLALALEGAGEIERARQQVVELLGDAPEYLSAYDALARMHEKSSNDGDAKAVLRMALEVSPNALHRHKSIGEIALRSKDLETAEAAFGAVVRKGRHAFNRSPDDHLKLSQVLMERSKFSQALETLADAKTSFESSAQTRVSAAALESLVYHKAGNPRESRKALDAALATAEQAGLKLPDAAALDLARACYLNRREHEGSELVTRLVSNNHDDARLLGEVRRVFAEADLEEQGESLIGRCVEDAVSINNRGVALAKEGDLEGAIELLEEAAGRMPENAHIVMNSAHSLIAHMQMNGVEPQRLARVQHHLECIRVKSPNHPKYVQVASLYAGLMKANAAPEDRRRHA